MNSSNSYIALDCAVHFTLTKPRLTIWWKGRRLIICLQSTCLAVFLWDRGSHHSWPLPGFSGRNCHVDVDECASRPCQNGGRCIEADVDAYRCVCPAGYTGVNCQTDIDECQSRPCLTHQVCEDLVNGYEWVHHTRRSPLCSKQGLSYDWGIVKLTNYYFLL